MVDGFPIDRVLALGYVGRVPINYVKSVTENYQLIDWVIG